MPDQSRGRAVSPSTPPHRMPAVLTVTLSPAPARTPAPAKDHPHREWRTRPHSSSPGLTSNTRGKAGGTAAGSLNNVGVSYGGEGRRDRVEVRVRSLPVSCRGSGQRGEPVELVVGERDIGGCDVLL